MTFDRALFFTAIRKSVFGGSFNASQVAGIERLFDAFARYGSGDRRHLSYILATDVRETGRRMEPVREGFATTDAGARAAVAKLFRAGRIKANYAMPNAAGHSFYGRGDVQLTHEDNYRRMGVILGIDLVGNPDQALDPAVSARIIVEGMLRGASGRGDFSGKALEDYISGSHCDFVGARYTVNGQDAAAEIAANARLIDAAFVAAGVNQIMMPAGLLAAPPPTGIAMPKPEPVPSPRPAVCPTCGRPLAA